MVEVDDGIAIVGDDRIIEDHGADPAPVSKRASLPQRRSTGGAFVSHFDVESECALWFRIALVENLRHNLITEIEVFALYPQLLGRHQQAHKFRRSRRQRLRLAELRDLV